MPRGESYLLQGQQGGIVLTGNSIVPLGSYRAIIEDSVFVVDSISLQGNLQDMDGKQLRAGQCLFGSFGGVGIVSGTVVVYYDDP
jgi:hypothetical protein